MQSISNSLYVLLLLKKVKTKKCCRCDRMDVFLCYFSVHLWNSVFHQ